MKVKDGHGTIYTAVQLLADKPLPEGAYVAEVDEGDGTDPTTIKQKVFLPTKDTDGDDLIDDAVSSVAVNTWILTDENGAVSLVHPSVFTTAYTAVK